MVDTKTSHLLSHLKEWAKHYIQKAGTSPLSRSIKKEALLITSPVKRIHMQFPLQSVHSSPYKEPQSNGSLPRTLRIFMLSPQPPAPQIGNGEMQWPGNVVHAKAGDYTSLFANTPLSSLIATDSWLSELEDLSSPRPGSDDLWLDGNPSPQMIEREPIVIRSKMRYHFLS